jgi:hypothetical protein
MASRKTYFGMGLPKDPTDPADTVDPADRSSPTVVDDEKVAESLKQLRSWYQDASKEDDTRPVVVAPINGPVNASVNASMNAGLSYARPTAVGHATGEAPSQPQRPIAPDPMRATMFGHDVHRFDLELARAAAEASSSAAGTSSAADSAAPSAADYAPRPADTRSRPPSPSPAPSPADPAAPDPFRLAEYLRRQAAQQHPHAAWVSTLDDTDVHGAAVRVPMAARVVFGVGVAALAVAIGLWIVSRDSPGAAPAAVMPPVTGIDRPAPTRAARSGLEQNGDIPLDRSSNGIDLGARTTVSRRPAALPRTAGIATAPMKAKRRPVAAETDEQADNGDDRASGMPQQRPAGEAPTAGGGGPPDGERAAGSGDGGRATGSGDGERVAPPVRPREPSRAARSTDVKTRNRNGLVGDADATLPPSTTD